MSNKIIWLLANCLVILSLVLAACAPAVTEKKEVVTKEAVVTKEEVVTKEAVVTEKVAPVVEKPKYGGTTVIGLGSASGQIIGFAFDHAYVGGVWWNLPLTIVYEELIMGDWSRGPAGTGETDFTGTSFAPEGIFVGTGALAESWSIPDNQTLTFKIRQGVRWQNKPPVNGREFTAADVVFNFKRIYMTPGFKTWHQARAPALKKMTDVYIDPNDRWTVVVKVEDLGPLWLEELGDQIWMYAPEVIAKYGDAKDWRNAVGTGAFILTDFISGSSASFVRNPDYWLKDPVGPGKGNQLPYLDGVVALQIRDMSTRMAAIRTGRIDFTVDLEGEDARSLRKTNPEINLKLYYAAADGLFANLTSTDPRAEPFKKKRVRQAMQMAIDYPSLVRDYWAGEAALFQYWWFPNSPYYTPLEKMPEIVQKMYSYHPEEAKKILAEEGYPNGFNTMMTIQSGADIDLYTVVQEYWRKNLSVNLEFEIKEAGAFGAIRNKKAFPALVAGGRTQTGYVEKFTAWGPPDGSVPRTIQNMGNVNDPVVNDAINRSNAVYGDYPARSKIIQELEPYVVEQAYYITFPAPFNYVAYQPWLKNNYGQHGMGYKNYNNWVIFAWIDQELKKKMGK